MSWILEYFVVYLLCVYLYICSAGYVELPIFLLSVSHIIQNKKKLYKFIRSDISCVDIYIYILGWLCRATYCSVVSVLTLGVSHAIQNKKKL